MKRLSILMACHNRREKTLACLDFVYKSILPEGLSISVYLTDDGSTDNTKDAVAETFPDVTLISGDGALFWNRGMRKSWDVAAKEQSDYFLWLNDDTYLNADAIAKLVSNSEQTNNTAIICGTTFGRDNPQVPTYGGQKHKKGIIVPNGTLQACEFFNGNCVLVPRSVFELVGNLDPIYNHSLGDFDYGIRASKLGIQSCVASDYVGVCESNPGVPFWMSKRGNPLQRLKRMYSPLGCPPMQFFVFDFRQNGLFAAVFHFFGNHFRSFFGVSQPKVGRDS